MSIWKIENGLCRCCLTEGSHKSLSAPFLNDEIYEIYGDMLQECFDINLAPVAGALCDPTYTICDACVLRLRDASNFKKQVLVCEGRFRDLFNRNAITLKEPKLEREVKMEMPTPFGEVPDYDELKEESLSNADDTDNFDLSNVKDEGDDEDVEMTEDNSKKKGKGKAKPKKRKAQPEKTAQKKTEDKKQKGDKTQDRYYTVSGDKKFVCKICHREFTSRPLVSQHYRYVHLKRRPRERKCPKCDEKVPGYLRAYHLEEVHGVPAPSCGVCGKKYRFPCQVIQHQKKVHMGERTVDCQICQKSFFNQLSLRIHMSTHSSERKYKCHVCEREFRWENNLKDHIKIHVGDKRYGCKVCGKAFVQKSTLKQHAMRNHPGVDVVT